MGIITTPVNEMKLLLASCEAFQTWLELTPPNVAGASAKIYSSPVYLADTIPLDDKYAVIVPADQQLDNPNVGTGIMSFDQSYSTSVLICEKTPKFDETSFDAFASSLDAILSEMFDKQGDGFKDIKAFRRMPNIPWMTTLSTKPGAGAEEFDDHKKFYQYAFSETNEVIT